MGRINTIISALLTGLCYQFFWPGMLVAFIPLFKVKLTKSTFFIWGIVYMACIHAFLINLMDDTHFLVALMLWLICAIYFGAFYGIGGLILNKIQTYQSKSWVLFMPVIWPIIEFTKQWGTYGNPNGNLGFSLSEIIHYIPATSLIGYMGLGISILFINIALFQWRLNNHRKYLLIIPITTFFLLALKSPTQFKSTGIQLSVIQSGIEQNKKMRPALWPSIEAFYINEIKNSTGNLIILPETILPTDIKPYGTFNKIQHLSNKKDIAILVGSFIFKEEKIFNGSYFIQPNINPILYKKRRLMPFGETLPFRKFMSKFIPHQLLFNDFSLGIASVHIPYKNAIISPLICLEGVDNNAYRGPENQLVTILANNAWFNKSNAGQLLTKFAHIYAASYQIPVIIAANYGKSIIINHQGKALKTVAHHKEAQLNETILVNSQPSFYSRWPWIGSTILLIFWGIFNLWGKRSI
ncbi:MAG: apolipoprotein N-acyltransferase [Candidatus Margulisiibacteriota bacterium]